jgi:hypothetical protein
MQRLAAIFGLAGALVLLGGGDAALAQRACSALETQLLQLQAGGISRSEAPRAEMLRQRMARAGCGYGGQAVRSAVRAEPRRERGVRGRTPPRAHSLRRPDGPQSAPAPMAGGTYRTMCVRSCDGYYFPVSFSTTRDRFDDDAQACARMCPEAEVGLYYHPTGGGPEEMISVAGSAYSELPAAFRYRETFDASCSCGRPAVGEARAVEAKAGGPEPLPIAVPRPRWAPAEDPETTANRQGGFAVGGIEPEAFASANGRFGRQLRQIGPRYGASQASELLIRPVSR